MLKVLFDQDFNHRILRGLIERVIDLDFTVPSNIGRITETDENHLIWAAQNRRVIVTHDVNTFPEAAYRRLKNGASFYGLIIVPQIMLIGDAVRELEIIISCSDDDDFVDRVEYLPIGLI